MDHADKIQTGYIEPLRRQGERPIAQAAGVALRDTRCGKCQKLLFRGTLRGEIKCPRCSHMNRWT